MKETGYGKDVGESWYGMLAPAGTSAEIVDKMAKAIDEAIKSPDTLDKLDKAAPSRPISARRYREPVTNARPPCTPPSSSAGTSTCGGPSSLSFHEHAVGLGGQHAAHQQALVEGRGVGHLPWR